MTILEIFLILFLNLLLLSYSLINVNTLTSKDKTYSDGIGTNALFNLPHSLQMRNDNNVIYICDTSNNMIRKLILENYSTTTLNLYSTNNQTINDNNLNLMITNPIDLSINLNNNILYVTETNSNLIKRIELYENDNNIIHLFVGSSYGYNDGYGTNTKFNGPSGITISYDDSYLLVVDQYNSLIRKIIISTSEVITFAGGNITGYNDGYGTNALFNYPLDITLSSNNIYAFITDNNFIIRKIIISTRLVTTFAGNFESLLPLNGYSINASLIYVGSITISYDDSFALITTISSISYINISSSYISLIVGNNNYGIGNGIGTNAYFNHPLGVVISLDNKYGYVTDSNSNIIRKINLLSLLVTTISGRTILDKTSSKDSIISYPISASFSSDNKYSLIVDSSNNIIRKYTISTNEIITIAGNLYGYKDDIGTNARFFTPSGIIISKLNNFAIISEFNNNMIRKIIISTLLVTTIAGNINIGLINGIGTNVYFNNPYELCISSNDNYLYIADSYNNVIRKIILKTYEVSTFIGRLTSGYVDGYGTNVLFNHPSSVKLSLDETYIIISDSSNHMIRKVIISTLEVTTLIGKISGYNDNYGTNALLSYPQGISFGLNDQVLYIVDSYNNLLRQYEFSTNKVTTIIGNISKYDYSDGIGTNAILNYPTSIAISSNQSYGLLLDFGNRVIRTIVITNNNNNDSNDDDNDDDDNDSNNKTRSSNKNKNHFQLSNSYHLVIFIIIVIVILFLLLTIYFRYKIRLNYKKSIRIETSIELK